MERRINTWLVCGTFDHAEGAEIGRDAIGEQSVRPAQDMVSAGKPWRFFDDRLYCRNLDDYNDLYTFFHKARPGSPGEPTDGRLAYVHTYVWCPGTREAHLRIGANDGYRAWLNGRLVGADHRLMRRAIRDQDRLDVTLEQGWNRLLLNVVNGQGIWGFYAGLSDRDGKPLDGLEYSVAPPDGALTVVTEGLPTGFVHQPYVWLEIAPGGPLEWRGSRPAGEDALQLHVPSASPFRLMAAGGTPPYRWMFAPGTLAPPGLWLDGIEGELRGVCGATGRFPLRLRVTDAGGETAEATLSLEVRERPTRWIEEARIGGLIHGSPGNKWRHGDPEEQARSMAREGYGYAAQTTGWWIGRAEWPGAYAAGESNPPDGIGADRSGHQDVSAYVAAFRQMGIRFGSYIGLPDAVSYTFDGNDFTLWPRYQDFLHAHFERLCVEYQPAVLYMDGVRRHDWDLDAIYSLVKTLAPECLLMANMNTDNACGDVDVINVEGDNDAPPHWSRWPRGPSGHNPKYVPAASWRYPFAWEDWKGRRERPARFQDEPDYLEWDEWVRVVVSLICEGFIADLDHTDRPNRREMHQRIGDWMQPRLASLVGTYPGPLQNGEWGYNAVRGDTIYLHLLRNGRGKIGWTGGTALTVRPLSAPVRRVFQFPEGRDLPFQQDGSDLKIDMTRLEVDPVDTILAIELRQ